MMRKNLFAKRAVAFPARYCDYGCRDCLFNTVSTSGRRRIQLCKGAAVFPCSSMMRTCAVQVLTRTAFCHGEETAHVYDARLPLDSQNTNMSDGFISSNRSVLDPDGDGKVDVSGGFHDAGDHVKFGLPQAYAASTVGLGLL